MTKTWWWLITVLVFGIGPGLAAAQEETPTVDRSTEATTTVGFDTSDFSHTTRSIVLTKLRRFFTLSESKDAELTDAIANTLLLKAMEQQAAGQADQATGTLAKYQRESELLTTLVETIQSNTAHEGTQAFLAEFATDRAVQLAAIEATLATNSGTNDLAGKLIAEQSKTLRDIVSVLEKEVDPVQRDEKLAKVFEHYAKKQAKLEAKLAKKLSLAARLDDETDDDELETDLEQEEDEALDEADELDEDGADELLDELDELEPSRRAAVLTKLLAKVPDAARGSIEHAIDQLVKSELQLANGSEAALKAFVESHSGSKAIQDKVIDRLKEHADEPTKKRVEAVKQAVEQERETAKKDDEKTKEDEQRSAERAKEAEQQAVDQEKEVQDRSSTTPPSSSTSPSAATTEVEKEMIELKVDEDGSFDQTSYSVKRGALLTVKFKNESPTTRTLTLSNGKTASVGKGETSIAAFNFDAALTFSVSGVYGSGTITVK